MKDFWTFEQLFFEFVGEFQAISASETRLREALRATCTRAEVAEAAKEAAERTAAEAKNSATAAAASATQAASALAHAQEELTTLKLQNDLAERQRSLLEERCLEMSLNVSALEREVQQLRPLQTTHPTLQRQYVELQERIRLATEETRKESTRLEAELRRVERCASGGSELRERARLAAAAHTRERKLAAAELQHTAKELLAAKTETARLGAMVSELQHRLALRESSAKTNSDDITALAETKAALEEERAGAARLAQALAAALADNATLAASLHAKDNTVPDDNLSLIPESASTNIRAIDSFLAE